MKKFLHLFILLLLAVTAQYCESGDAPSDAEPGENAGVADSGDIRDTPYPERAYWGDSHVHTGWSADAGMDGAITTPEDAYRFALGE